MQQGMFIIKKPEERLLIDEDAVITLYKTTVTFFQYRPNRNKHRKRLQIWNALPKVKATIKRIIIQGNDVYMKMLSAENSEQTRSGLSQDDLIRSIRELAQTGHFDPENLQPDIKPNLMTEQWI